MSDLAGRSLGQYELRELVRHGGMASVYKGYQASLDRWVAVKVLDTPHDATFIARFEAEARAIARFQHQNIIPVHDFGKEDGYLYLVVTYVEDGRCLADLIGEPMAPDRALRYGQHLLAGLAYAHEKGVVHRDIKPANVLLPSPDWPMLADFGIAKLLLGEGRDLTQQGMVLGTAAYMAPEQAFGLPVDQRTDLYSLGVVLYELVTGRVPFDAETPVMVLMKQAYEPPEPPRAINPDVPIEVEQFLLQALAKDPGDRFQSADAMAAAITATLARLEPQEEQPVAGVTGDPLAGAYAAGVTAFTEGRWSDAVEHLAVVQDTDPDYEDVEALLQAAVTAQRGESGETRSPATPPRTAPPAKGPVAKAPPAKGPVAKAPPAKAPTVPPPSVPPPAAAAATTVPRPPAPRPATARPATARPATARPAAAPPPAAPPPTAPPSAAPAPPERRPEPAQRITDPALAPAEPGPAPGGQPPRRRRGWLVLAGAGAAVLVIWGAAWLWLVLNDDGGGGGNQATPPVTTAAPAPPEQPWTATARSPLGVESAGVAVFQNKVWLAGGFDGNRQGRTDVLIYDPASDSWSSGPKLPEPVTHAVLVSTGQELYVIGGYAGNTTDPIATVRRLDESTSTWIEASSLPVPVGAGAAEWDGQRIVYAGGVGENGQPSPSVFALENETWRRVGRLSQAREHLAAATSGNGTVYFLAGEVNKGNAKTVFGTVDAIEGDTVRKIGELPTARGSVGGFHSPQDGACAGGGRSSGELHAEVECITPDGVTKKLPSLKTPRHGLGMAVVDGSAYALLGSDNQARTFRTGEVRPLGGAEG
jgi:hypothetical protein